MEKKYTLTDEIMEYQNHTLHRIQAIRDFDSIKAGTLGGWIERELNLSHEGICWVADNAMVYGSAVVRDNARILHQVKIYDNALITDNVYICNSACIHGHTFIYGNAQILHQAHISGNAIIGDDVLIVDRAVIKDYAIITHAIISDDALIYNNVKINGYACISKNATVGFNTDYYVFRQPDSTQTLTWTRSNNNFMIGSFQVVLNIY